MTTQIVAIQLDQVEGVQEYAVIVAPITNDIERSYAVGIAADCLAIDYAGASAGASTSQRSKVMCEVIAGAAVERHARSVLPGNNPKPIVLDLVQLFAAGGKFIGFAW